MAGKIIFTETNLGWGSGKVYKDGQEFCTVKSRKRLEMDIEKDCYLTAKIGPNLMSNEVLVKANKITYITFAFSGIRTVIQVVDEQDISESVSVEEKSVFEFDGKNGDILIVYEDRIVLKHKGVLNVLAMGVHGDKTIYFTDLTAVQFKRAGFTVGHLQFSLLGGNESRGGVIAASSDENTITFVESKNYEAEKAHNYINNKIRETRNGSQKSTTVVQQTSAADELKKFKELLDSGVITQEEFDAKKKQLLGL